MYKITVWLLFFIGMLLAEACFQVQDKADSAFNELDEMVLLSFRDATSCEPMADAYALIKIYDDKKKLRHKLTLSTDEVGDMSFEATHIQDINDGYLLLAVKKEGYILYVQKLPIYLGSLWIKHFLLSKDLLPDSMRFVLSWADKPQDLDLHLKASDFHISYRNKRNITHVAALDRDARSGFGPETITLDKLKRDKSYQVLIYNYSKKPSFKGKAQLTIYKDNRLDRIIRLPKSSKRCFQVATMADGKVTYTTKAVDNKLCK